MKYETKKKVKQENFFHNPAKAKPEEVEGEEMCLFGLSIAQDERTCTTSVSIHQSTFSTDCTACSKGCEL
jgi:hypothetical protein